MPFLWTVHRLAGVLVITLVFLLPSAASLIVRV